MKKDYILTTIYMLDGNYVEVIEKRSIALHDLIIHNFEHPKRDFISITNNIGNLSIPIKNINYIESLYQSYDELMHYYGNRLEEILGA